MNSRKIFLILTLLILLSDLIFVGINYYASRHALNLTLDANGRSLRHSYQLTLELVYENMLQISTYIASQKNVQQLFLAGKQAVTHEGGGAGGASAADVREKLYQSLIPSWSPLMEEYGARQLHFHLGPGSLSFLRVHKPNKFGDRMDDVRHIIVDSFQDKQAKVGFEIGRIYAGLRGVTPVWSTAGPDDAELIGVLEVGSSYQTVLDKINQQTGVEMMVLLNQEKVHSAMWPESISKQIVKLSEESSCYVEAISNPLVSEVLANCEELEPYKHQLRTFTQSHGDRFYGITHFPLHDYQSQAAGETKQVGMVVMLMDVTESVMANRQQLKLNLVYAVVGFAVIEILLYLVVVYGSRRVHSLIDQQTDEIHRLKEFYKNRSERDSLTALYNHRCFNERLQQEMGRAKRSHAQLSLLMCDLDNFKLINDSFGHLAGDAVLQQVAAIIERLVRSSDFAGRYGGEEFIVALPETGLHDALGIAQRLVESIASLGLDELDGRQVTASVGAAMWDGQESLSELIQKADSALYNAKQQGKNRAVSAS
ncbi:MAG: diguanylate cyclase [Candidatus Thiodiazotropha taylori]|nr:diguanylate cyclase [Candidatus Thiodiazotropha taylori]